MKKEKILIAWVCFYLLIGILIGHSISTKSFENKVFSEKYLLARVICGEDGKVTSIKEIKPSGTVPISFEVVCETKDGWHDLYFFDLMDDGSTGDGNKVLEFLARRYWKMEIKTVYAEARG